MEMLRAGPFAPLSITRICQKMAADALGWSWQRPQLLCRALIFIHYEPKMVLVSAG